MARQQEMSADEARALVKPTPDSAEAAEFEMEDYGNLDAPTEEEMEGMEQDAMLESRPQVEEEPGDEASPEPDWKAIAEAQAAQLAEIRKEQESRRQEDLEKRVKELPEEERVDFLLNYQKEQERARQVEEIRTQQMTEFPLASLMLGKVSERFEMELDDPGAYREALAGLDADFNVLVTSIVEERVKSEMEKFYAETGQQWGTKKIGGAQPRPVTTGNPVRQQYEQTRKSIMEKGKTPTSDELATLIRQRQRAKG